MERAELLSNQLSREELLFHPDRHRGDERTPAARRGRQIGLDESLKLEERLVVEADLVDAGGVDPGFPKAVLDGTGREALVGFLLRETLLLLRHHDYAVLYQ